MPIPAAPNPNEQLLDTARKAFDEGLAEADGDTPELKKVRADVARWLNTITQTEKWDEASRKTYVKCRRYARGDSGFMVDANIVGTNIDILEAFLYAKDPDVDIGPAKAVEAPSLEAMIDSAMLMAEKDPSLLALQDQAQQQAQVEAAVVGEAQAVGLVPPVDPVTGAPTPPAPDPMQAGQDARQSALLQLAQANLAKIQAAYDRKTRENKTFADTGELVVSRQWKDGRLKDRGRPWCRSGLTVGVGILKASSQERTSVSPETQTAINDLVAQVASARALRMKIEDEYEGEQQDANIAELERQLQAIRAKSEVPVSRMFCIDNVAAENFLVAPGYRIADHMDAPWNAERIPKPLEDICKIGNLTPQQKARITKYTARKPEMVRGESANMQVWDELEPADAQQFKKGGDGAYNASPNDASNQVATMGEGSGGGCFGMIWEIWDRDSNSVLWMVEGLDVWLRPAWNPPSTTRFYPYFLFCTSEVDGQRHPQSPVERSWKLVDEYNRIGSAEAKHRARIIPKTGFNAGAFDKGEAEKLEKASIQEMVALKLTNPKQDLREILFPISYAAIDPALYDRTRIIQEIERIWGVQEALGGSINTEKTATEAEIAQGGFNARTGSRRDSMEATMSHLALYTLQLSRAYLDFDKVREIAGPNAFWPTYQGAEDIRLSLNVDIKAGSTGKPNTRADREAWGMLLPQLEKAILTYAQMTGASPMDTAESIKKLARITAARAGEKLDVDSLFPKPGMGPIPVGPPGAGAPGGGGGGQPPGQPGVPEDPAVAAATAPAVPA